MAVEKMDLEDNTATNMLQKEPPTPSQPEGKKFNQYMAAVIAALGAVSIGTALAWTSPVESMIKHPNTTILSAPVDNAQASLIGSLINIGAIFGALPAGFFADKFGRKPVILAFCIPFILGWVLILFAQNVLWLFIARFTQGVATGVISAIVPMFIGEIAESSIRGTLGSFFQMFLVIGILILYILGMTSYAIIAIGSLICPVLLFALLLLVPETPIHLMKSGDYKKAESSLRFYRGDRYNVAMELDAIQKEIDAASRRKASFSDLFTSRANKRALVISLGLMVFQQFSGINAVIFYSKGIFEGAGSTLDPTLCAIIVGVVQVLATGTSVVLVDKLGRRILLLISDFVMTISLGILGLYFYLKENLGQDVTDISTLPLLSVVAFIVMFSLGFGPIPWMMVGELFSPDVKGSATGIAVGLNWSSAFIVTLSFSFLIKAFGSAVTFWIFAGICLIGTMFTFAIVPETKGKSLPQIQRELAGNK
uniref:Facilitated trehalose transporter Tret1 n=1 Tax=Cacopsylla melanoneura TaxID=428564 RepID=A0A8D8S3C8_9HEMI